MQLPGSTEHRLDMKSGIPSVYTAKSSRVHLLNLQSFLMHRVPEMSFHRDVTMSSRSSSFAAPYAIVTFQAAAPETLQCSNGT
jgi:hypothetical protein